MSRPPIELSLFVAVEYPPRVKGSEGRDQRFVRRYVSSAGRPPDEGPKNSVQK